MLPPLLLLLSAASLCAVGAAPQGTKRTREIRLEDRVPHKEHEIPDEQVIQLPVGRFPEPRCDYSVHWNDRRGQQISGIVRIGDPLYHKWQCVYPQLTLNIYCMMVYSCSVGDGHETEPIIDKDGCTLYPAILPNVQYFGDLEAGIASQVFAMNIDQITVYFNCSIRLLIKEFGRCPRPQCTSAGPIRR